MIRGKGISAGIGIGNIKVIREQKPVFERRRIRDTEAELKKLKEAVDSFAEETKKLADKVEREAGKKEAEIQTDGYPRSPESEKGRGRTQTGDPSSDAPGGAEPGVLQPVSA